MKSDAAAASPPEGPGCPLSEEVEVEGERCPSAENKLNALCKLNAPSYSDT